MDRTRFYNRLAKWLAIAALPCSSLLAQTGTQQDPILDTLLIQEEGLFLKYRYAASSNDSTVWFSSPNNVITRNENSIFVGQDTVFQLKAKKNSLWYYDTHYFNNGIKLKDDTLIAPFDATAQYEWSKDGVAISSPWNRISQQGPGLYLAKITIPGTPSHTATYSYFLSGPTEDLEGSDRQHAITDSIAYPVFNVFHLFQSSLPYDSIQWDFNGASTRFKTTFLLKENGNGVVYLLKQNKWYKQIFSVQGVVAENGTLFTMEIPDASYQWFKDGVLVPDSNSFTLGNLKTAKYTVKITLGSSSGEYAGQVCTYTLDYKQTIPSGTKTNPHYLKDLIVINGLEFSVDSKYSPDSLFWKAYKFDRSSFVGQQGGSYVATEPGVIEALVFQNGEWYSQGAIFEGITYDTVTSGKLSVPVVANAVYRWYYNGNLLPNETGATIIPTQIGQYKVEITWVIGASLRLEETKTAVFTFNVTSLPVITSIENEQFTTDNFQVYPNPANGYVSLRMPSGSVNYRIENASAATVLTGQASNGESINISDLAAGVYYVHFIQAEKQVVKRLVVR